MSDRIQSNPPRPIPTSDEDEYYAGNLSKPRSGIPGWVWGMIAVSLLLVVGCVGLGSVGFLLFLGVAPQPAQQRPAPAATARAVSAPLPAPQPDDR